MSNLTTNTAIAADVGATPTEQGTQISLDPDLVQNMSDVNNALFVQGDAGDALVLHGDWAKLADAYIGDDGHRYDQYTGQTSGGTLVTLYVDQDVPTRN